MKKTKTIFLFMIYISYIVSSSSQISKPKIPTTAKIINKATKSEVFSANLVGQLIPKTLDLEWRPTLINKCIQHNSFNDSLIEIIKDSKNKRKISSNIFAGNNSEEEPAMAGTSAILGTNFTGNSNTGSSPLDNSIAISNAGKIVSVANSSINFYNSKGDLTFTNTIEGFINDNSITNVCDPVVLYDVQEDRFIFFAQECSGNYQNSKLIICFSETNDPNLKWWIYKIGGNVNGTNTWFDYPKLAISENELYITGNCFNNDHVFEQAVLYQIEKKNGYVGQNVYWQYWLNIASNPFTLLPVSLGHKGYYGPGCFLVATNPSGGSTIDLYDLTNDMSASNEELLHYSVNTATYSPAGDGYQNGSSRKLDNGDCRALSGFILDGIIHFVFHSDYIDGFNGINYNRLDVKNMTNTSSTFGLTGYEYSYPAVASYTTNDADKSVLIGFLRTGSNIYPEIRAVSCDNNMKWGSSILVKSGESYCSYTGQAPEPERWGDYTGIARKHNNNFATVWISGMYGTTANNWKTWIGEITENPGTSNLKKTQRNMAKVIPNPVSTEFAFNFQLNELTDIQIDIFGLNGKLIKNLYKGNAKAGQNYFSFSRGDLLNGEYIIVIKSQNGLIKNEKFVVGN